MKFKNFTLDEIEYAAQGNAILGIRDSGKTYTATWLAERLLDKGIPFIAFDPIGVWRYLRVGQGGKPGYPVVVAGDDGDLPLTAENAVHIVQAAMQENIPLVIDLYSMSLSKTQWRRIVQESVELLLYKNKTHGLRHIFIEEAAEFVPQRISPGQAAVYGEFEQLSRMGRNASLGYTLINQRAEEINKAVLEICDCLFLHRQKGRHSLTALSKWLDIADATNREEVIKSLSTLPQGLCWVWRAGSNTPALAEIPAKNTVHPDPKNPERAASKGVPADVSEFIDRLNHSLKKQAKAQAAPVTVRIGTKGVPAEAQITNNPGTNWMNVQPDERDEKIHLLEARLTEEQNKYLAVRAENDELKRRMEAARSHLKPQYDLLVNLFNEIGSNGHAPADLNQYAIWMEKLVGKRRDMLQILIERKRVTKIQLAHLVGMAPRSGTFEKYLSNLRSLKLVQNDGEYIVLNEIT